MGEKMRLDRFLAECGTGTRSEVIGYIKKNSVTVNGATVKDNGIRTRTLAKLSDGSTEILDLIKSGHITYIINTRSVSDENKASDGHQIRLCATENNSTLFTSLDTVRVLVEVLEETTLTISTIDAK